jgi:hypothetical protein
MTEEQWLACTDPRPMLEFLRGKASDRKLRLFACACCRLGWDRLTGPRSRRAVEAVEQIEEGLAPAEERATANFAALQAAEAAAQAAAREATRNEERAARAGLLRDLFGNPFRPASVSPAWPTPQVVAVAQAAYHEREMPAGTLDAARLSVLADALEDAGCDQTDILDHLRGPGPHVRGCWVVDLILGKS